MISALAVLATLISSLFGEDSLNLNKWKVSGGEEARMSIIGNELLEVESSGTVPARHTITGQSVARNTKAP